MIEIISILLCLCLGYYIGFTLWASWHFGRTDCEEKEHDQAFVSIIVPARNEAKNISSLIQNLLDQDYPSDSFECLLVNDHSNDQTQTIVQELLKDKSHFRLIGAKGTGKKAALATGIEQAKGEIILQTDADCSLPPTWIRSMAHQFTSQTAMLSGPVQLLDEGHFFGKLQALESLGLIALGGGSMNGDRPNMCNGANLAFRKHLFDQVGGYTGIDTVASGDDELLMQKFCQLEDWEIRFVKCREAIVQTPTLRSWRGFASQRLRWVSKVRAYSKRSINLTQLLYYLSFWLYPWLFIIGFWWPVYWNILFFGFFLKFITDAIILSQSAIFFRKLPLLAYLPILQPIYIVYVLWIGIAGNVVKTYTWKGRKVS